MSAKFQYEAVDIAQAVIDRMADCPDARFKQVMTGLISHLHAFAREVDLQPEEWMTAIEFLTATGQKCDDKRQEFILLSDTLGLSMLVVALQQARSARAQKGTEGKDAAAAQMAPTEATEATVQGPFFWEGAPQRELGADLAAGMDTTPTLYSGKVTDTSGKPVANCRLDVWSSDDHGLYDLQKGADAPMDLRAQFRTDAGGRYHFWVGQALAVPGARGRSSGHHAVTHGAPPLPAGPHAHDAARTGPSQPDHPHFCG